MPTYRVNEPRYSENMRIVRPKSARASIVARVSFVIFAFDIPPTEEPQ